MTSTNTGFFSSALRWLRAGYPEGIPATDRIPLIALLRHRLTKEELDQIVQTLVADGSLPVVDHEAVEAAIAQVTLQPPSEEDCARVAGRLAAAGWPLSKSVEVAHDEAVQNDDAAAGRRPIFLRAMLDWLRAGYPKGIPSQDYIPLLALLRRRLSDDEVMWVAHQLLEAGDGSSASAADIGVLITKLTDEMPSDADIERVRAHMESSGHLEPPR